MRVLVIGSGGREHALVQALARSPSVTDLLCRPGNPGIAALARCLPGPQDPEALADLAGREGADLTIVGPEAPLVAGVVDAFVRRGLRAFGPGAAAARIEGDKAWSKAFMARHGIPTARFESVESLEAALEALSHFPLPMVVKDAGLRAGKGVTIAHSSAEAEAALRDIFTQPGACAVLEEFMTGQEVTLLALTDGTRHALLPASQDHKTIFEGDVGPMTGGMGVIAPYPLTPEQLARAEAEIVAPTLAALRAEGTPFVGVLYAGLMLTPEGPRVVEFNCRLGDPEAEAVLPLLESDLAELALACVEGRLDPQAVRCSPDASAVVVLAAPGYPGKPERGVPLDLPETGAGETVFQAGTALEGGQLVSQGGRVLAVQALGPDLNAALARAYALVAKVGFVGAQFRRDIGFRVGAGPRGA